MSKLSTLIAAVALVAAGAASAQTADAPLSREAVIADLVAARNSGELAAIQGEKGVDVTTPASVKAAAVASVKLPRQAVLTIKPTEVRSEQTAAALAADHGENAARELGDFPLPNLRRASAMASNNR